MTEEIKCRNTFPYSVTLHCNNQYSVLTSNDKLTSKVSIYILATKIISNNVIALKVISKCNHKPDSSQNVAASPLILLLVATVQFFHCLLKIFMQVIRVTLLHRRDHTSNTRYFPVMLLHHLTTNSSSPHASGYLHIFFFIIVSFYNYNDMCSNFTKAIGLFTMGKLVPR